MKKCYQSIFRLINNCNLIVSTAQGWVQQALRSSNARFLPNPQIPNTFQVVTDLGTTIGTKWQTSTRAIVGFDGKVINAFPVK